MRRRLGRCAPPDSPERTPGEPTLLEKNCSSSMRQLQVLGTAEPRLVRLRKRGPIGVFLPPSTRPARASCRCRPAAAPAALRRPGGARAEARTPPAPPRAAPPPPPLSASINARGVSFASQQIRTSTPYASGNTLCN